LPDSETAGKPKKNRKGRLSSIFHKKKVKSRPQEEKPNEEKLSSDDDELPLDEGTYVTKLKIKPNQTKKKRQEKRNGRLTRLFASSKKRDSEQTAQPKIAKLNALQRFAYLHISRSLPTLPGYREAYEQAGLPLIYESYISSSFLLSFIASIPAFVLSLLLETRVLSSPVLLSVIASIVLSFVVFSISLLVWLLYPLERRRGFKSKLERQLAYSFGILGALSAAGIGVERLFERLATTESNPVLAELARRFLRNVKVFGLDTESALKEVASHSPSLQFSKMLESIAIAYRTSGSMHDLVAFESSRLFSEKKENLRKGVNDLSVMAELYITLVVVGPIIFIVMLTIFTILPTANSYLPNPTGLINLLVFLGIPAISVVFIIILDSMVNRL
jgi:archaeal flagellar protein FlaJ